MRDLTAEVRKIVRNMALNGLLPSTPGSPVAVGSNADMLDGQHASAFATAPIADAAIPSTIARTSALHSAVTLAVSGDVLLGLTGQALSLDTQTANLVLAGPSSGVAAAPTFRALVAADVPASILSESTITRLATVTGIDAKAVAATTLYTVPAGKTFIPTLIAIRVTAFTVGSKAVQAVASFGGNSASYDDFVNSATYTVAAVDTFLAIPAAATAQATQAAGDVFKLSIETGSDATTETWAVDVFGYLV